MAKVKPLRLPLPKTRRASDIEDGFAESVQLGPDRKPVRVWIGDTPFNLRFVKPAQGRAALEIVAAQVSPRVRLRLLPGDARGVAIEVEEIE